MNILKCAAILVLLSMSYQCFAQKERILRSNTDILTIKEGGAVYKNIWRVDPESELDVFVTNPFDKQKEVTFYSDIDSLKISVRPGRTYNFVVLLNGERARTQINTSRNLSPSLVPKLSYVNTVHGHSVSDTIPFRLGEDNRIYLAGHINGSDTLSFLFDMNAGANVINEEMVKQGKVSVKADGRQENIGSDGVAVISTSSGNKMSIGSLAWEQVPLLMIPYGEVRFDAVLSWCAFEDKIIEIDYDRKQLIIHHELPVRSSDYSALETKMIGGIPYVLCKLLVNGQSVKGWFGFDTGGDGNLIMSQVFAANHQLNGVMKQIGQARVMGSSGVPQALDLVRLPVLILGDYELYRIPLGIYRADPEGVSDNEILGNNILKRFNCIIDLQDNKIYIRPNSLLYTPM